MSDSAWSRQLRLRLRLCTPGAFPERFGDYRPKRGGKQRSPRPPESATRSPNPGRFHKMWVAKQVGAGSAARQRLLRCFGVSNTFWMFCQGVVQSDLLSCPNPL
jgi:hypothetical protein